MCTVKLTDVVWFQEGPGVRNTQYTDSGIKLLNVANLVDGKVDLSTSTRYISEEEAYGKYRHFLVDNGDFIIASSGIKVKYFDKKMGFVNDTQLPLCMNTSTIRFKALDENRLNIQYFMYYLKSHSFKEQLFKQITGSAQLNFGPSHLKQMCLPMADIDNQNEICEQLNMVASIIEKRQQQLSALDTLIKARFVEMFCNGNNCKEWPDMTIVDIALDSRTGPFGSALHHDEFVDSGVFVLGIDNAVENKFSYNRMRYITEEKFEQLKRYTVKPGDVIITIMGTVGRSAVIPDDMPKAINTKHLVCITPDTNKVNAYFLSCAFQIHPAIRLQLQMQSKGAIMDGLNLTIIKGLHFTVPPIAIQDEFVSFVSRVDKLKAVVQKSLDEMQLMFDSLMQKYFG